MAQISNYDEEKLRQALERTTDGGLKCSDLPIGSGGMLDAVLEGIPLLENDSKLCELLRHFYSEIC